MKKINKIIILVIILIIIILGGTFAYTYMATDLFKSDKEMFFKSISQITNNETGIINKNLKEYFNKKNEESYQNKGNIKFDYSASSDTYEMEPQIANKIKELTIGFEGVSSKESNIVNKNITIDYGSNVTFPINYIQDQELYGLQTKYIGSKYVTVRNSNLKQLASRLGMDATSIPNKIEVEEKKERIKFTDEELSKIKNTYIPIIKQELTDDNFSRENINGGRKYILTISGEQLKNLMINLLETFKQDKELIKKINDNINLTEIDTSRQITQQQISELLKELQEMDSSEFKEVKIVMGYFNKSVNEIMVQYDKIAIDVKREKDNGADKYLVVLQLNSDEQEDEKGINTMRFEFEANYNGLEELKNISENYVIKIKAIANDNSYLQYKYDISNDVKFGESINLIRLDNSNAYILNDIEDNTLTNFLSKAGERIQAINEEQMKQLGLKEYENPLLYTNFITHNYINIIRTIQSTMEDTLEEY